MKKLLGLTLFAVVAGLGAKAQAPAQADSDDIKDLMALLNTPIVSASKHAERTIEAPSVVSLAVRDQVDAYGWTSLNDVLYTLPGFSASQDYNRSTVSSRGLFEGWNNNHLLMQVDGIPFNDNIYGSAYTWEITPLFMAKAVEVVRGPGSALYGGNAMDGVIQLKSISAQDLASGGEAQIRLGQNGLRIYDFAIGHVGDRVASVVGFNAYQSDGNSYMDYDGSGRLDASGNPSKFFVNDTKNSQYAWAKLEGLGDLKGFTFQYHWQAWNNNTGHGWLWETPDQGESMQERRQLISLAYAGDLGGGWHQEYMVRHQIHDIDWNTRYIPSGETVFGITYPGGGTEFLNTSAYDDFLRAQFSVDLAHNASLLFGFEGDRFLYSGDNSHSSNLNMVTLAVNPGNANIPLGPWLAWVKDRPITNTGFFAQFDSGKLMGDKFKLVVGVRADSMSFNYNNLDANQNFTGTQTSKTFSNTSPRVALIFMPSPDLAIKLMSGKAFRSPAPAELAGANTLSLGSNITGLQPETLTTNEMAVDWIVTKHLNWRTNFYWTKFNDEIAYSTANNNLSTNLYTLTTEGLESELLFGIGAWKGFANFSYARRLSETILDPTITPSTDVTWVPSHMFKFGVIYESGSCTASLNGTYTGQVERRSSDLGTQPLPIQGTVVDMDTYRPTSVDAWFTLNAKLSYEFAKGFTASLMATNLLDKQYYLAKSSAFPFDYQGAGRTVSVGIRAAF